MQDTDALYYLTKDIHLTKIIPIHYCNNRIIILPKKNKVQRRLMYKFLNFKFTTPYIYDTNKNCIPKSI